MSSEYIKRVTSGIIKQLREGTAPWIRPWRSGERYLPHNPISGHQYRGINVVWLMVQSQERGYLDTRWMTYRQAESVGAQVGRGQKGTTIQYWKWEGTRPMLDDSGTPRLDEQGHPETERVQYTRPRVFTATVFNAEQIDGLAPGSVSQHAPEWERHEKAELILRASGVPIQHVPRERAYYSVRDDHIVLPLRSQFPTGDGYYAVGLHEVGHSTAHPSRLNRDLGHPFGSQPYAREELRAEIASLMMGDELGIGHDPGQHVAYVESWIKVLQDDPLEVFRAASAAEKIQTYVLGLAQQQTAQQEDVRAHSASRGNRMDPEIVAQVLNHELEPHGVQVILPTSETARGFELYRADGVSPVGVTSAGSAELVDIAGQRVAAGLHRFPVHQYLQRPVGLELGYVIAPSLGEAREKLRRGEWVATESREVISGWSQIDVFDTNEATVDRGAETERTTERERLRLADARGTDNGESVAAPLQSNETTAQREETPAQARAVHEAAEGNADRPLARDQPRERRRRRGR
jgi:antirestriction protein ArdC